MHIQPLQRSDCIYKCVCIADVLVQNMYRLHRITTHIFMPEAVIDMSSIPTAGTCVCGKHGTKKCSVCWTIYCSVECQRADWSHHKPVCAPTHRGVRVCTDAELDRGHRKACTKLSLFEHQVTRYYKGKDVEPEIKVGTHPDLPRVMTTEWLAGMAAWKDKAVEEMMLQIATGDLKFSVSDIGSVQAVVMLNGKSTRVELYLPDQKRARSWAIIMEPLANSPWEPF